MRERASRGTADCDLLDRTDSTDGRCGGESSRTWLDDRSVSEVVGYILVFGLVVTSIGIVTVAGTGTLEDAREDERVSNAERAFDVVADNMASIYERNSPSRATEIDLPDSQIVMGNEIRMTVEGDGQTLAKRDIQPIVFRLTEDRKLIYEAGAVFRVEDGGGVVLRDPPMLLNENRVHVPVVETHTPGAASAGSTTILLRGKSTERSVLASDTTGEYDELSIEIETTRYDLWERTLSEQGMDCTVDESAVSVRCTIDDPETVYVTLQRIEVTLIL